MNPRRFSGYCLKILAVTWITAAAIAPAWDYHVKKVTLLPVESYPARTTVGAVTVAADPYDNDEKSFTAFDVKDLNSRGYFPMLVIIQNSSPDVLRVKTRDITLVRENGQELYTTPATLVVQDVIKGSMFKKLPKVKNKDEATSTRAGSPLIDFTDKELTSKALDPGTLGSGFIFFYSPEPKKNLFAGSKLRIPQIANELTRQAIGPFIIPMNSALSKATASK